MVCESGLLGDLWSREAFVDVLVVICERLVVALENVPCEPLRDAVVLLL